MLNSYRPLIYLKVKYFKLFFKIKIFLMINIIIYIKIMIYKIFLIVYMYMCPYSSSSLKNSYANY